MTEKTKIITNQFDEKILCKKAWRSMPKIVNFDFHLLDFDENICNDGFAKYCSAFNVHNCLQSESNSFVFNSSCDWRSCLSETFCGSDRSSAQTFMSKYIKQLRGKQNYQFLDEDSRLFLIKLMRNYWFIKLLISKKCFADCFLIVQQLKWVWTKNELVIKFIGSLQPICFDFTNHSSKHCL